MKKMGRTKKNKLSRKRKLTDAERFPDLNEKDIEDRRNAVKKVNTEKSDKKCKKIFLQWLARHKYYENYWEYDVETLNQRLSKFWFEARTQEGEHYTTASLGHIRYGLNRCLTKHGSTFNIVEGADFKPSQLAYSNATKELKKLGKGHRKSYPAINSTGQ